MFINSTSSRLPALFFYHILLSLFEMNILQGDLGEEFKVDIVSSPIKRRVRYPSPHI